jgi:hypothetical protein
MLIDIENKSRVLSGELQNLERLFSLTQEVIPQEIQHDDELVLKCTSTVRSALFVGAHLWTPQTS